MKIAAHPSMGFRRINEVPRSCLDFVKPFSKPTCYTCPVLDIVEQERVYHGFMVRSIIYNARESVTFSGKIRRERFEFQSMMYGAMYVVVPSVATFNLDNFHYTLIQMDRREYSYTLQPGQHHFLSVNIAKTILEENALLDDVVGHWLTRFNPGASHLYGAHFKMEPFKILLAELLNINVNNRLRELLFGCQLNELLLKIIEDQGRY
ncbi:hypothetical protein [Chitinophaga filiformis]|uniref:CRP/FNR family transcriptional regulator, anaerobic regulatory protein n=1 Tax=Chitinophaga filiformis TaxID=104663 RepID=A0ABY4HWA9_CHIFI|nr:hypothetical protein [Chitinophaga filiformis]UPK68075.1 hypothetical protein MYF79_24285 [Chitinophaga filiformis]